MTGKKPLLCHSKTFGTLLPEITWKADHVPTEPVILIGLIGKSQNIGLCQLFYVTFGKLLLKFPFKLGTVYCLKFFKMWTYFKLFLT